VTWQRIRGHDALIEGFRRAVRRGRLAHAYLFTGAAGVGKRLFAVELAKALLCENAGEDTLEGCDRCPACVQVMADSHPDFFTAARPPEARQKPKVSAFTTAKFEKIMEVNPDLVLTFSDLQADLARELIVRGVPVIAFTQRSVSEILELMLLLGRVLGREAIARELVGRITALAVLPSSQHAGVGRRLIEASEQHFAALGLERIEVTSGPLHEQAYAFYRRLGYQDQGVRFAKPMV